MDRYDPLYLLQDSGLGVVLFIYRYGWTCHVREHRVHYSRYTLSWQLCPTMQAVDAETTLQQAMQVALLAAGQRPRVLTDNGSAFISKHLREYFDKQEIKHVKCAPYHPSSRSC